jgi:RAB protein geranylgeranyltransferase component A
VTLKLSTTPLVTSLREVFAKGLKSINWKRNFKILMDSVEDYARQWAKREKEDLDTLSEWVKSVRSLIQIRIKKTSVGL